MVSRFSEDAGNNNKNQSNFTSVQCMSNQLLKQLLEEVRSLKQELRDQRSLGFSHGVQAWAQRINIGEPEDYDSSNGGCAWYRWNSHMRRVDVIPYEFLTGRIARIWLDDSREYKGKPLVKLMIRVEAECVYELVSSYDNLFARSFLWGIYQTSPDRFKEPVNIQVRPGYDKDKQRFNGSVWCNLNQGRDYLNRGYPKEEQGDTEDDQKRYWEKIRTAAITKFNQSNQPPRTIVPVSDNPNADRLKAIAAKLGIPSKDRVRMIKAAIRAQCPYKVSKELSKMELISVRDRLLIDWAFLYVPDRARLMEEFTAFPDDMHEADLCACWLQVVVKLSGGEN